MYLIFFTFRLLGELYQEIGDHPLEIPVTREQLNHYRNMAENVRSELAATLVKFECAQSEVRLCIFTTRQWVFVASYGVKQSQAGYKWDGRTQFGWVYPNLFVAYPLTFPLQSKWSWPGF